MLNRYGVFEEMFDMLRDVDTLFRRTLGDQRSSLVDTRGPRQLPAGVTSGTAMFHPPVSCFTRDKQLVVRAELPGVSPDDVEVIVTGGRLTIKGEKKDQKEVKEDDIHFIEISSGRFERSFGLPEGVKTDQIRASFTNGVLEITMPSEGVEAARKVPIETSGAGPKAIKAA